jgi:hypothetical protein
MLESLYRAGFNIADEQLDDDARRKIMRRVHEGAEVRLMGGYADGSGASRLSRCPCRPAVRVKLNFLD